MLLVLSDLGSWRRRNVRCVGTLHVLGDIGSWLPVDAARRSTTATSSRPRSSAAFRVVPELQLVQGRCAGVRARRRRVEPAHSSVCRRSLSQLRTSFQCMSAHSELDHHRRALSSFVDALSRLLAVVEPFAGFGGLALRPRSGHESTAVALRGEVDRAAISAASAVDFVRSSVRGGAGIWAGRANPVGDWVSALGPTPELSAEALVAACNQSIGVLDAAIQRGDIATSASGWRRAAVVGAGVVLSIVVAVLATAVGHLLGIND